MMQDHTVLSHQFACAFGNSRFEALEPLDLVSYIVLHHDAGWFEFDRNPATDPKTNLPFNLTDTPAEHITVTSRRSPEFNERHHAYSGLLSSMHSWGLYNGRYGLSDMVLIDKIAPEQRPLADQMLENEVARQRRLKDELAKDRTTAAWLDERHLFQNYKQLQFLDTLALYFNRIHPSERGELKYEHVPISAHEDVTLTIRPRGEGVYSLSPYPFTAEGAVFAYAGRLIEPGRQDVGGSWTNTLAKAPTVWESFRLIAD
jgi:Protein of unknown function (DUF3891)